MAPYVQHYYCHGCHEYIEAMADDNNGYDSDSDEEWEEVMEECPSCGSPFFELLNSEENEQDAQTANPPIAGQTNGINTNNTTNNNYNIPFPPDMPEQIRNMIRNVVGQGGMPHQMRINIGVMEGEFPNHRDNGLPASCKDFTVEDVLNILNTYPNGVPREGTQLKPSSTEEKHEETKIEEEKEGCEQATPTTPTPVPNDGVCTVCLESVYAPCSSEVVQMHCTHCYHRNCLKTWFEKGVFTCPTCRQPAIKDDA